MALPLGFGRDEAVTMITSRGVEHTITLRVNRLEGRIDVERAERAVPADARDRRSPCPGRRRSTADEVAELV